MESTRKVSAILERALARRAVWLRDSETTIYRVLHGDAEELPGVAVDQYGDVLIVGLYRDLHPAEVEALLDALWGRLRPAAIYVKRRPREASRLAAREMARLAPEAPARGERCAETLGLEHGLGFVIRPGAGLNVGLFPDMREVRFLLRARAAGKTVLNTFAYTCGFGVAALAGGAGRVLNVDLAKPALEWGKANYQVNGFAPENQDFVFGDVFDWLDRFRRRGESFDWVIIDPPGFSRARGRSFSAGQDYGALAEAAARVTAPGGSLLACCNVGSVTWRAFEGQMRTGLKSAGREAREAPDVERLHEPSIDFPDVPRREAYLKVMAIGL